MNKICIFTATPWEFAAVHRAFAPDEICSRLLCSSQTKRVDDANISLVRTGVGPIKAGRSGEKIIRAEDWDLIVSTGFAAALVPSRVGSILVATEVCMYVTDHPSLEPKIRCDEEVSAEAFDTARSLDMAPQHGPFATVSRVIGFASEKRSLSQQIGAIGLDMESYPLGQIAIGRGIPFLVVRTVSDLVDEDLPVNFNLFLRPSGWMRGLTQVLTNPESWAGLKRLRAQTSQASREMTRFFKLFLQHIGNKEPYKSREESTT